MLPCQLAFRHAMPPLIAARAEFFARHAALLICCCYGYMLLDAAPRRRASVTRAMLPCAYADAADAIERYAARHTR